jgi:DNA-binding NarL/FixJ family response regulator
MSINSRKIQQGSRTALPDDGNRKLKVFRLPGQGLDTRSVATSLHISIKTVRAYCARIKAKLNLANATEFLRRPSAGATAALSNLNQSYNRESDWLAG